MAARRRAILFLPSPQGLVEYDVLEDAAFLGPAKEKGLTAAPSPFREAVAAVVWNGAVFEAKALPGEAAPEVNGAPGDGAPLADGARIRLGEHVVLFREVASPAARAAPAPLAATPPPSTRRPAPVRRPVRRTNPWVTGVALLGAVLLLAAAWRAVEHLKDLRGARETATDAPEPPQARPTGEAPVERAARELEAIRTFEREHPEDVAGAMDRYRDFAERRHPGTPEADAAGARIRELMAEAGRREMDRLEAEAPARIATGDFEGLLADIHRVEARYGTTPAGKRAEALEEKTRAAARKALDDLLLQVGPLVATDPRRAHAALVGTNLRLPPDLASELAGLLERTDALIRALGGNGRREPGPAPAQPTPSRPPQPPTPPPGPPAPGPGPSKPPEPLIPAPATPAVPEADLVTAWRAARADLLAGRYEAALAAYDLLLGPHAASETVRAHRTAIAAGRLAARAGVRGPAALLAVPAETKHGRLEVEYGFDDATVVEKDFTAVKPFPSDLPESVDARDGVVRMSGASGLFHNLVFAPDVRLEVEATVEIPRDIGLIALEDSDAFRAVLFNAANTQFKLKKGDAARVQPGHVLWFVGEGAWSAADAGVHGFIKIAERPTSKLEGGDRLLLELERKKDRCSGGFQGKTDGVSLDGTVRGDDGRGMGPAQVGVFTNGGGLVVRRVRISGVVDERWWQQRLKQLVAADPGPQ